MRYKQAGYSAHTQSHSQQENGEKETLYRVLLVEDDIDDSFFAQQALKTVPSVGETKIFPNGKELLEFLTKEKNKNRFFLEEQPTIVLLDLRMPLLDGFETLRKLRMNYYFQHIKVAVLTSYKKTWNKCKSGLYEADAAFSKPLDPKELETFLSEQKEDKRGWRAFWRMTRKFTALI